MTNANTCKTAAAAKRTARRLFGDEWALKYAVTGNDEDGYDVVLRAAEMPEPGLGDDSEGEGDTPEVAAETVPAVLATDPPVDQRVGEDDRHSDDPETLEEADTPPAHAFKGDRLKVRKANYVGHKHCGDEVAVALAGVETGFVLGAASKLGLDVTKWAHLNNGQRRMNAGNCLRTLVKKATPERAAEILAELRALPRTVEIRVIRNGRPVKRCADQAAADAFIAEVLKNLKEGEAAPKFATEEVVAA